MIERVRRTRSLSILQALDDQNIFAPHFKDPETWASWRAFLAALFALPLRDKQLELYRQCTGRTDPPTQEASEAWLICGRRSGKSFTLALIAVFLACFRDWRPYLAAGERATVMLISADRKQSRMSSCDTCVGYSRPHHCCKRPSSPYRTKGSISSIK